MFLSDRNILELCSDGFIGTQVLAGSEESGKNICFNVNKFRLNNMIDPFFPDSVSKSPSGVKIPSYGLSSYGYDIRLAPEFKIFDRPMNGSIIDPREPNQDDKFATLYKQDEVIVPPGGLLLSRTIETFSIPRNVLVICLGKSTLARCGAIVNVTPLEPEWSGQLVVEITNGTNHPMIIRANEGVAQLVFMTTAEECTVSYNDRRGKYQDQSGVTGNL